MRSMVDTEKDPPVHSHDECEQINNTLSKPTSLIEPDLFHP